MAESESLCVYCRRHRMDPAWQPFCSERCRMADLGRWLSGDYRVPGETSEDPPDSGEPSGPAQPSDEDPDPEKDD